MWISTIEKKRDRDYFEFHGKELINLLLPLKSSESFRTLGKVENGDRRKEYPREIEQLVDRSLETVLLVKAFRKISRLMESLADQEEYSDMLNSADELVEKNRRF